MSENESQLIRCFTAVFPTAPQQEVISSNFDGLPGWDSLRGVTLLAILNDEFGVQLDMPELLELESFAGVKTYLSEQGKLS